MDSGRRQSGLGFKAIATAVAVAVAFAFGLAVLPATAAPGCTGAAAPTGSINQPAEAIDVGAGELALTGAAEAGACVKFAYVVLQDSETNEYIDSSGLRTTSRQLIEVELATLEAPSSTWSLKLPNDPTNSSAIIPNGKTTASLNASLIVIATDGAASFVEGPRLDVKRTVKTRLSWVFVDLTQGGSLGALEARIAAVLSDPLVDGLHVKTGWVVSPLNFATLDNARRIAEAAGKKLAVTVVAGANTPVALMNSDNSYSVSGRTIPCPVVQNGGPNATFEAAYRQLATDLLAWGTSATVTAIELPWFGPDMNHSRDMRTLCRGYTQDRFVEAHARLMQIVKEVQQDARNPYVSFTFNGFGTEVVAPLVAHKLTEIYGQYSEQIVALAEGWNPEGFFTEGGAAAEDHFSMVWAQPVLHAVRAIRPDPWTSEQWQSMFANAEASNVVSAGIFLQSFEGANGQQLRPQLAKWRSGEFVAAPTTPPTPPPTPTPTATAQPPRPPRPGQPPFIRDKGVWVLQQVASQSDLNSWSPRLRTALDNPAATGLSIRVPWRASVSDFALFDGGKALADEKQADYSIRYIAGRFTPAEVIAAGPSYVLDGDRIPCPMNRDGSSNAAFENAYAEYNAKLFDYAASKGISLLHLSWYGEKWAELNNSDSMKAGCAGYSKSSWLAAHEKLVDIAAGLASNHPEIAVEWPLSGHNANEVATELGNYIKSRFGSNLGNAVVQGNGWAPDGWGVGGPNGLLKAQQAYDTKPYTEAEWTSMFCQAQTSGLRYVEVYTQSFETTSGPALGKVGLQWRDGALSCPSGGRN